MPGSLHGEMFEMALDDALAVLALDQALAEMHATHDEVRELRKAARHVVQAHGLDVVRRYCTPEPAAPSLRVVEKDTP